MTGRRRGGKVWMMDEEGEGFDIQMWLDYTTYLREDLIGSMVDKAVRERRVWLAAACSRTQGDRRSEADRTSVSGAVFTGSQEG